MTFPRTLAKKAWRDAQHRKFQVIAVALVLSIGAGMAYGFESSSRWRLESMDDSYAELNTMDFQIDLLKETYANISQVTDIIKHIPHYSSIQAFEYRLIMKIGVNVSTSSRFAITQGKIFGINITSIRPDSQQYHPSVNDYKVIKGGIDLQSNDVDENVCILEYGYGNYYKIKPGESIGIITPLGEKIFKVIGLAHLVEYFMVVNEESWGMSSESQFAGLYMPLSTVQNLYSIPGLFNQLIIKVNNQKDEYLIQTEILSLLKELGYYASIVPIEEVASYKLLYEDVEHDTAMFRAISAIFLLAAGLGTYITVSRLIISQRRLIGISMALGHSKKVTIGQYLFFCGIIGILGALGGLIFGYWAAYQTFQVSRSVVNLPVWYNPIYWDLIIFTCVLAPSVALISGLIPAYNAARMKPVDAIRLDPLVNITSNFNFGIGSLIGKLPLSLPWKIPFRNIFRNRRRTMSTITGLALSMIVTITIFGMLDSIDAAFIRADQDIGEWNLRARSFSLQSKSQWDVALQNLSSSQQAPFTAYELGLEVPGEFVETKKPSEILMTGVANNSWMRSPNLKKGSLQSGGIVISRRTAAELEISIGSTVKLKHLKVGGLIGHYEAISKLNVTGIHASMFAPEAFVTLNTLQALINSSKGVNVLYGSIDTNNEQRVRRLLYHTIPGISFVESKEDMVKDTKELVNLLRSFMLIAQVFSMILAFVLVYITVSINISERTRELGTMLTLGTPVPRIVRMVLIENLLLGFLSLVLGLILGWGILDQFYMEDLFRDAVPHLIIPTILTPVTLIFVGFLMLGTIVLAQIPTLRKITHLDLAVATKVLE